MRILICVDDHATIYLNGVKIFRGDFDSTRSPEIALKVGDHENR
jgi:hypothetical protein